MGEKGEGVTGVLPGSLFFKPRSRKSVKVKWLGISQLDVMLPKKMEREISAKGALERPPRAMFRGRRKVKTFKKGSSVNMEKANTAPVSATQTSGTRARGRKLLSSHKRSGDDR